MLKTTSLETLQSKTNGEPVFIFPDGRMKRVDAAKYLGFQPTTLAMLANKGSGPPYTKLCGRVFYFKKELDAWIAAGHRKGGDHV